MEILLLLTALVALAVLAVRFGHDSRESAYSEEHTLAALGFTWDGNPASRTRRPQPQRAHPLRHTLAAILFRLADWLYPEVHTEVRRLGSSAQGSG